MNNKTVFSESKVILTGIVTNTDLNSNIMDIVRPVAQITIYNQKDQAWVDNIYLIFSDNASARKFRGIKIGDILLITGEFVYLAGIGYAVYLTNYQKLHNNTSESPLNIQKTLFFNGLSPQNFIMIKGNIIYVNKEENVVTITHDIKANIRGDLEKKSFQPVSVTNDIKGNCKKGIFIGEFTNYLIRGELYETI